MKDSGAISGLVCAHHVTSTKIGRDGQFDVPINLRYRDISKKLFEACYYVISKWPPSNTFVNYLTHVIFMVLRWQVHLGEGLLLRIFVVAKVFGFGDRNLTR